MESGKLSSLNHHFWGDISAWFYRYLGGLEINPHAIKVSYVNVAPIFVEAVNEVTAEHLLPKGLISVHWTKQGNTVTLELHAPSGLKGELQAPKGWTLESGAAALPICSGTYTFVKTER